MKDDSVLPLPEWLTSKMAATPQNPRYHREGSVLAHTQYVLDQYLQLRSREGISDDDHQVLYWAALLHDAGKTVTTVFQDGRHRSPGHERAGLPFALEILLQRPEVSDHNRRRILDLVRWHGLPLRMMQHQDASHLLPKLGTRTDLRLLGIFSQCDFLGRDCDDKPEMLHLMRHFREELVPKAEYALLPHQQLSQLSRSWNLRHKNAAWKAYLLDDMALLARILDTPLTDDIATGGQGVTLVIGPALSGKSTYIGRMHPDAFVLDLSELGILPALATETYLFGRKLVEFRHLLRSYLNRHHHVVMESRELPEAMRMRVAEAIRDMPARLDYVVMETGLQTTLERNLLLDEPLSASKLRDVYNAMELVHPWEAHEIRYVRGDQA